MLEALSTLHHPGTAQCVAVERAFLASYGGGCNVPAACHAWLEGGQIQAVAVSEASSGELTRVRGTGDGPELGTRLAQQL